MSREDSRIMTRRLQVENAAVKEATLFCCRKLEELGPVIAEKIEENNRARRVRQGLLIPLLIVFVVLAIQATPLLS